MRVHETRKGGRHCIAIHARRIEYAPLAVILHSALLEKY